MDYYKDTWKVIEQYFASNKYFLTNHHLDSYDDFVSNRIMSTIKVLNPIRVFKSENNDTKTHDIEVFVGGEDSSEIFINKPTIFENGTQRIMFPNEARLKDLTYHSEIFANITIKYTTNISGVVPSVTTVAMNNVKIGSVPIMLHSKLCVLRDQHPSVLREMGECKYDQGGYFIIDGKEKVIVAQERIATNVLFVNKSKDPKYSFSGLIRCTSEENPLFPKTINIYVLRDRNEILTDLYTDEVPESESVEENKEEEDEDDNDKQKRISNAILLQIPNISKPIPLFIIFRALGIEADKDIIEYVLSDLGEKNSKQMEFLRYSLLQGSFIYSQREAVEYIANFVEYRKINTVRYVLLNDLFPNISYDLRKKALFLGYIIKKLIDVAIGVSNPSDRDSYIYKRVGVSGFLVSGLFRDYYNQFKNMIRLRIDRTYNYDGNWKNLNDISGLVNMTNRDRIFRFDIIEEGLRRSIKGNWGRSIVAEQQDLEQIKEGISQDLNRLSYLGFISHMRRVSTPIDTTSKIVGPHKLHSSQWGVMCPCESPDGGSIGILKNLAIFCKVSFESSSFKLIDCLREFGMLELNDLRSTTVSQFTKIFVNNNWVGSHEDPRRLFKILKLLKRNALINIFTSISWNIFENEIHVLTESGRCSRPLYVVYDGELLISRVVKRTFDWTDLIIGKLISKKNFDIFSSNYVSPKTFMKDDDDVIEFLSKTQAPIEYVDVQELNCAYVAMDSHQIESSFEYVHHPSSPMSSSSKNKSDSSKSPSPSLSPPETKSPSPPPRQPPPRRSAPSKRSPSPESRSPSPQPKPRPELLPRPQSRTTYREENVLGDGNCFFRALYVSARDQRLLPSIGFSQNVTEREFIENFRENLATAIQNRDDNGLIHALYERLRETNAQSVAIMARTEFPNWLQDIVSHMPETEQAFRVAYWNGISRDENWIGETDSNIVRHILSSDVDVETFSRISLRDYDFSAARRDTIFVLNYGGDHYHAIVPVTQRGGNTKREKIYYGHDYCEIHPSTILSVVTLQIPLANHNQAPRNIFSGAQGKQAIGVYATNFNDRIDTMASILHYPQKPLLTTRYMSYINNNDLPHGENLIVALASYTGYNLEDAIIINKNAIERGMFNLTYFKNVVVKEEDNRNESEKIEFNNPVELLQRGNQVNEHKWANYTKLDKNGFPKLNEYLTENYAVVGRTKSKIEYIDKSAIFTEEKVRTETFYDRSMIADKTLSGIVDKVFLFNDEDNLKTCKIRLRKVRIPELGDKCCSRHAQKGVIGMVMKAEDMPFTKDGIVPDIIINPHGIPSRMTIAHLMECLLGKIGCHAGTTIDGTPFDNQDYTELYDMFEKDYKMDRYGNEVMYNGRTGTMMDCDIFIGPIYYERLKHMTVDKINYRTDDGPITNLTHQPTSGRGSGGGLRIGEMETFAIMANGMSQFMKESVMERSDKFEYFIDNKNGQIAIVNEALDLYKPFDETTNVDFSKIATPYSFKLLHQELTALGLKVDLRTKDEK